MVLLVIYVSMWVPHNMQIKYSFYLCILHILRTEMKRVQLSGAQKRKVSKKKQANKVLDLEYKKMIL